MRNVGHSGAGRLLAKQTNMEDQPGVVTQRRDGVGLLVAGGKDTIASLFDSCFPQGVPGGEEHFGAWLLKIGGGELPEPGREIEFPLDFDRIVGAVASDRSLLLRARELSRDGVTLTVRAKRRREHARKRGAEAPPNLAAGLSQNAREKGPDRYDDNQALSLALLPHVQTLLDSSDASVHQPIWKDIAGRLIQVKGPDGRSVEKLIGRMCPEELTTLVEWTIRKKRPDASVDVEGAAQGLVEGFRVVLGNKFFSDLQSTVMSTLDFARRQLDEAAANRDPGMFDQLRARLPKRLRGELDRYVGFDGQTPPSPEQTRRAVIAARRILDEARAEVAARNDSEWLAENYPGVIAMQAFFGGVEIPHNDHEGIEFVIDEAIALGLELTLPDGPRDAVEGSLKLLKTSVMWALDEEPRATGGEPTMLAEGIETRLSREAFHEAIRNFVQWFVERMAPSGVFESRAVDYIFDRVMDNSATLLELGIGE